MNPQGDDIELPQPQKVPTSHTLRVANVEKGQGRKPDAYADYRKILDRKDVDAVMIAHQFTSIATPPSPGPAPCRPAPTRC